MVFKESLIPYCFSFLSILDFGSPFKEGFVVLVHRTHMVLVESVYSSVYVLYPVRFLVIEMLLWEYVQGSGAEFTIECRQILCRFSMLLHQNR